MRVLRGVGFCVLAAAWAVVAVVCARAAAAVYVGHGEVWPAVGVGCVAAVCAVVVLAMLTKAVRP